MTSPAGSIVPIQITLGERTGITLWAPPWEDADGDEWQGFLGDGAKIVMFPSADDLFEFIATHAEHDLSDHPDWPRVQKLTPAQLRPDSEHRYDLEAVYEWAAEDPTPVNESQLANVVEMVLRIAEACEDGALSRLIGATPEYAELVNGDEGYTGREGARAWSDLGDTIAGSWDRALRRVAQWLDWRGDFGAVARTPEPDAELDPEWERIGAKPIELIFSDTDIVLTVRAVIDDEPVFLGSDGEIAVFIEPENLARYCRDAEQHELVKLEFWDDVANLDDEAFVPQDDDSFDLGQPSMQAAAVLQELAAFLELDADASFLANARTDDDLDAATWAALVAELHTCLDRRD